MATKFSTTANISSFTSADIAKLTPAEIGTFTKIQQSALTAAQAIGLTDAQVAVLPLKNILPETIAAIPLKSIVSLAIKSLSIDQFSALTTGEIGALTSLQVASLSASEVSNMGDSLMAISVGTTKIAGGLAGLNLKFLTPDNFLLLTTQQIAALTSNQIKSITTKLAAAVTPEQAAVFTSDQAKQMVASTLTKLIPESFSALDVKFIAELPSKSFAALTADDLGALTDMQMVGVTSSQIKALKSAQIQALSTDSIALLSASALGGFDKNNIMGLPLSKLSEDQFKALTPIQLGLMSAQQIADIDDGRAALLSSNVMKALTSTQVKSLTTVAIPNISPNSIKGLTAKNIGGLSTDGVAVLTSDQVAILTPTQIVKFSFLQMKAVTSDFVLNLLPSTFKAIPANLIPALPAEAFANISSVEIKALSTAQMKALTIEQFSKLDSNNQEITLTKTQRDAFFSSHSPDNLSVEDLNKLLPPMVNGQLQDSAENILTKLDILQALFKKGVPTKSIIITDGSNLTLTKDQLLNDQDILSKIGGSGMIVLPKGVTLAASEATQIKEIIVSKIQVHNIVIKDHQANIQAGWDKIYTIQIDPPFGNIVFTDSDSLDFILTETQFIRDQADEASGKESLLKLITSPYHLIISEVTIEDINTTFSANSKIYGFSVRDTAEHIAENWTKLENLMASGKLYGVTSTTGAVSIPDTGSASAVAASGVVIIDGSGSISGAVLKGSNASNNLITGGAGNDTITGGLGADSIVGGAGNNVYVYNSTTESTINNVDHLIGNFSFSNKDIIKLPTTATTISALPVQSSGLASSGLTVSTLNSLLNSTNGTATHRFLGGVPSVAIITTTDNKTFLAMDVLGAGLFNSTSELIDITGSTGIDSITGSTFINSINTPEINTVSYNAATGVFSFTGSNITNSLALDHLSITSSTGSYTFNSSDTVTYVNPYTFSITLSNADKTTVNSLSNSRFNASVNWEGGSSGTAINSQAVNVYGVNVSSNSLANYTVTTLLSIGYDIYNSILDSSGNLYCVSHDTTTGLYTLKKIAADTAHTVTTLLSSSYNINNLIFDSSGNLYCSAIDLTSRLYTLKEIAADTAHTVTTLLSSSYNNINNLIFDSSGNLYCSVYDNAGLCTLKEIVFNSSSSGSAGNVSYTLLNAQSLITPVPINNLIENTNQIELSKAIFTAFSGSSTVSASNFSNATAATSATDYLYYNATTGGLYYAANGNSSASLPVEIAIVGSGTHPASLSAGDFQLVS